MNKVTADTLSKCEKGLNDLRDYVRREGILCHNLNEKELNYITKYADEALAAIAAHQSSVSDEEDLEPSKEQNSPSVASHSSTSNNSNQQ